jgi:outer membrane protein OmpA-like peptidoglycan-associated protein
MYILEICVKRVFFGLKCILFVGAISNFSMSCNSPVSSSTQQSDQNSEGGFNQINVSPKKHLGYINLKRKLVKLGHAINTAANEYHPVVSQDGSKLIFSGMDRSGFFDFKLDFNQQSSCGGEDIFVSHFAHGTWSDAKPIATINTQGHEVVTQLLNNGNMLVCANYPEKFGPKDFDKGAETTDLFQVSITQGKPQIIHFPEPVNSIYSEFDGFMAEDESFILFASDRPGAMGEYHKKGWKWNESFWGNTDLYVSLKKGDSWSKPINLGNNVNSNFAERTPWLSADGLTLYLSSNGYENGRPDLNIYAFKRKDRMNWTDWTGPESVIDANSATDDWGYSLDEKGVAYFARAVALDFEKTQPASGGDGGMRESNFRTGYSVHGLQSGSCLKTHQVEIYSLKKGDAPDFTFDDVCFENNSAKLHSRLKKELVYLIDFLKQNETFTLRISGHTDNKGTTENNMNLSRARAKAVEKFLLDHGYKGKIEIVAFGEKKPKTSNATDAGRKKNRRVEVQFVYPKN